MQIESIPATGFVRLQQVLRVFPVSKSSWFAGIKDGRYPASVKLGGGRSSAWKAEDIRALIERTSREEKA